MKVFTTISDVVNHLADALDGVEEDFDAEDLARRVTTYDAAEGGFVFLPQYDDSLDEEGQQRAEYDFDAFWDLVERLDLAGNERFRMIRDGLGLTGEELGALLDVTARTIRRWDSDDEAVPEGVWDELSALEDQAEEHVKAGGADPAEWPRGWVRAVEWRIHCAERANRT